MNAHVRRVLSPRFWANVKPPAHVRTLRAGAFCREPFIFSRALCAAERIIRRRAEGFVIAAAADRGLLFGAGQKAPTWRCAQLSPERSPARKCERDAARKHDAKTEIRKTLEKYKCCAHERARISKSIQILPANQFFCQFSASPRSGPFQSIESLLHLNQPK